MVRHIALVGAIAPGLLAGAVDVKGQNAREAIMGRYAKLHSRGRALLERTKRREARKASFTPNQVHTVRPLDNVAVAFLQDPANFFSAQIFPMVNVLKQSDTYYVWDRGDMNRDDAKQVGPGAEYPVGTLGSTTQTYAASTYKYSVMIPDEVRHNADQPAILQQISTRTAMQKHAIRRDRQWAADFFKTGVFTGGATVDPTPGTKFDNASGNWITSLRPEIRALVQKGLRREHLTCTLPPAVFDAIIDHSVTTTRLEQMNSAKQLDEPNEVDLARILRIGKVVVGESVYNAAAKGAATDDQFVLSTDDVLITYAPPDPALMVPSAGYTMAWTPMGGPFATVEILRRNSRDSDQVKTKSSFAQHLVAAECGMFMQDVLT